MLRLSAVLMILLFSLGCFLDRDPPTSTEMPPLSPAFVLEEIPEPKPAVVAEVLEVPPLTFPETLVDPAPQAELEPEKIITETPPPLPPLPTEAKSQEEKPQIEEKPPTDGLWEKKPERRSPVYIFEILKTSGKQPYYWRVKASNGQILLTSEKYVNSPVKIVEKFTKRMQPGTFKVKDLTKK